MTMPSARHGGRFAAMRLRARRPLARFRRFDPVRVDELVALALLVEIELQVWLSPYIQDRVPTAIGGLALSAAVAVRRHWPFGAVLVALVAVVAQEALGGRVTQHTVGALLALVLVFYAAGAFLRERSAWLALGLGLAGSAASVVLAGRPRICGSGASSSRGCRGRWVGLCVSGARASGRTASGPSGSTPSVNNRHLRRCGGSERGSRGSCTMWLRTASR